MATRNVVDGQRTVCRKCHQDLPPDGVCAWCKDLKDRKDARKDKRPLGNQGRLPGAFIEALDQIAPPIKSSIKEAELAEEDGTCKECGSRSIVKDRSALVCFDCGRLYKSFRPILQPEDHFHQEQRRGARAIMRPVCTTCGARFEQTVPIHVECPTCREKW